MLLGLAHDRVNHCIDVGDEAVVRPELARDQVNHCIDVGGKAEIRDLSRLTELR